MLIFWICWGLLFCFSGFGAHTENGCHLGAWPPSIGSGWGADSADGGPAGGSSTSAEWTLSLTPVDCPFSPRRLSPRSLRPSAALPQCSGATPRPLLATVGAGGDLWVTGVGAWGCRGRALPPGQRAGTPASSGSPRGRALCRGGFRLARETAGPRRAMRRGTHVT